MVAQGMVACLAQESASKSTPLTFQQRRQLREWIGQYRRHRNDPLKRAPIVEGILSLGTVGAKELFATVDKDLTSRLAAYRGQLQQKASSLLRARTSTIQLSELARLQQEVVQLREVPDLTKEMIVAQADPAMRSLRETLLIGVDDVLVGSKALQRQRAELLDLGALWQRCHQNLDPSDADRPGPDETDFATRLQAEELAAIQSSMPMPPEVRGVLAANGQLSSKLDTQEARAILAINATRFLVGLEPLAIDPQLCAAARDHSGDMQRLDFFSHTSPVEGKTTALDRARNFGTTVSGENIYVGAADGPKAVDTWFHSPGHFKNLLGGHRRVGWASDAAASTLPRCLGSSERETLTRSANWVGIVHTSLLSSRHEVLQQQEGGRCLPTRRCIGTLITLCMRSCWIFPA
jgi:uncharacterized protein YkwD